MNAMKYEEMEPATVRNAREALRRSEMDKASKLIIAVALHSPDAESATAVCLEAARSPDPIVRGNAILAFGHLARRFGSLERYTVERVLVAALSDPEPYVRGHASSAVDDIQHFLGWVVRA